MNMKLGDLSLKDQSPITQEARERMLALSRQYSFPASSDRECLDEYDLAELEAPREKYRYKLVGRSIEITRGNRFFSIPLTEVLLQREQNLIDEQRLLPVADSSDGKIMQYVVAPVGYATDLHQLLDMAKKYGISEIFGARRSCGANDVFLRYGLPDACDMTTIGFRTPEGDKIEVLYIGPFTEDPNFIDYAVKQVATANDFDFTVVEEY